MVFPVDTAFYIFRILFFCQAIFKLSKPLEGQIPQDILMGNTEASLVDFEMDIYWVVTASHDRNAWFKKIS